MKQDEYTQTERAGRVAEKNGTNSERTEWDNPLALDSSERYKKKRNQTTTCIGKKTRPSMFSIRHAMLSALVMFLIAPNTAHAGPKTVRIHHTEVVLPHAVGLDDELMDIPEFAEFMSHLCPTSNTLQWAYVSLADKEQILEGTSKGLQTYVLVETPVVTERMQLTTSHFSELQAMLHAEHETLFSNHREITEQTIRESAERFDESYGTKVGFGQPQIRSIGLISEGKHQISVAYRLIADITIDGQPQRTDKALVINTLLAANKLLYVYVYATYDEGKGLVEAISISKEFRDKMLKANPSRG
ncbi:MAG: hypothetical protein H0S80_09585 [Desulfovibrionaceae bacterium]|nr:hypothetical protein [Desulfovibrionaceae bacterium]